MSDKIVELPKTREELTSEEIDRMEVYNELLESREKGKILKGRVVQYKPNVNVTDLDLKCMAVAEYKGWKIVIPMINLGLNLTPLQDLEAGKKEYAYQKYITAMLGSTISFVIHPNSASINPLLKMAIASRTKALELDKMKNYIKLQKGSNKSRMEQAFEAGQIIKAKVISATANVAWLEVYGMHIPMPKKEISWRYVNDIRDILSNGDIIDVKIVELEVNHETGQVNIMVSKKATKENSLMSNWKMYSEGTIVLGKITGITLGYWVQVGDYQTGIDVFCKRVNTYTMPAVGDTVAVKIFKLDGTKGIVYGSIETIIEKKDKWSSAAS